MSEDKKPTPVKSEYGANSAYCPSVLCPLTGQHWFEFKLTRMPRLKTYKWWHDEGELPYVDEKYNACTPCVNKQDNLEGSGIAHYSHVPEGVGYCDFPEFYKEIDDWFKEQLQ